MKKIVTIGSAMRDVFIEQDAIPMVHLEGADNKRSCIVLEEGKKIEIKHVAYHVGGGAANSAVSFKRLGFDVMTFFKIGDDAEGAYILQELAQEHVDTTHVICAKGQQTGTSFIIPCPSGNKTALVYRGASVTITESELPWQAIGECNQLYITSLSQHASHLLLPITTFAKAHNKPVAVNPGGSQLKADAATLLASLPYIDILILNSGEAQEFMYSLDQTERAHHHARTDFNLSHYFRHVLARGPNIVVVTDGAQGVHVATNNTVYFYPSLPTKVVSTLGAGDAFGSCFVAQLMHGKTVEQALVAGSINSSCVIGHLGTQVGLLTQKELEKRLQETDMSRLQSSPLTS